MLKVLVPPWDVTWLNVILNTTSTADYSLTTMNLLP